MQIFLALLAVTATAESPISKVLELMSSLQQKVLKEGEAEQKAYEKFAEWCKDEAVSKQYEIETGEGNVEGLKAAIEKETATISVEESKIDDAAQKVAVNSKDLAAATEIRKKEAADFSVADADLAETIDMLSRAIGIIEKNMRATGFVQGNKVMSSEVVTALQALLQASSISSGDRSALTALVQKAQGDDDDFLQSGAPDPKAYESQSGGILDILEDMKEKAVAMKNDGVKAEMNAKHSYEMLKQSLENTIAQDNKELAEAKSVKAAAEEAKAIAEGDLSMAEKELAEDKKYLSELSTDCQTKAADWEVSTKSRAEELEALAAAKKIIMEKTGGAADKAYGLLQQTSLSKSTSDAADKVVSMLQTLGKSNKDVALSQLALRVKAAVEMQTGADPFAKVKGMIQEMIDKLLADAAGEASHKEFCDKEMGESKTKITTHTTTITKLTTRKDKMVASIEKLTEEIAALTSELAYMVKQLAKMEEIRVEQKATYKEAKKDYEDGIEGLDMALKILRDYYGSGESLIQQPAVSVHSKATGEGQGIIAMLEVAMSDFSKMLADITVEEESAVREYEKIKQELLVKKAIMEADIKYKTSEKTSFEKRVTEVTVDIESEQTELTAVYEYYEKLKPGCIAKPMTYEERKKRREAEIAGLKEALAILEGESATSFLALRTSRRIA